MQEKKKRSRYVNAMGKQWTLKYRTHRASGWGNNLLQLFDQRSVRIADEFNIYVNSECILLLFFFFSHSLRHSALTHFRIRYTLVHAWPNEWFKDQQKKYFSIFHFDIYVFEHVVYKIKTCGFITYELMILLSIIFLSIFCLGLIWYIYTSSWAIFNYCCTCEWINYTLFIWMSPRFEMYQWVQPLSLHSVCSSWLVLCSNKVDIDVNYKIYGDQSSLELGDEFSSSKYCPLVSQTTHKSRFNELCTFHLLIIVLDGDLNVHPSEHIYHLAS